jgi:hypothetical protein
MFALNQIVIPRSADVSSAGWQRSEPVGRQRSQEMEEWWLCQVAPIGESFNSRNYIPKLDAPRMKN